jgi:hypothetical protein
MFPTLQGGTVETLTTGEEYTVNDANVVCGNVQTQRRRLHHRHRPYAGELMLHADRRKEAGGTG